MKDQIIAKQFKNGKEYTFLIYKTQMKFQIILKHTIFKLQTFSETYLHVVEDIMLKSKLFTIPKLCLMGAQFIAQHLSIGGITR